AAMARIFLFLVCVVSVFAQNITLSPIILPAPPGPYVSKLSVHVLTDTSRPDPYNSSEPHRRLVVSVFDPVPKSQCSKTCEVQYMPPATAAHEDASIGLNVPLLEQFKLSGICCNQYSNEDTPLLIFSTGFGVSRLEYGAMAQYVSSYGYTIVTVDHTYDADIVEFPDGQIALGVFTGNTTDAEVAGALAVRTEDVLFVLDAVTKGAHGCSYSYKANKVGMYGHSLGGVTASNAMLNDTQHRITGGINLDGGYLGPVLEDGLGSGKKSFLLFGSAVHNSSSDPSWEQFWETTDKLDPQDWRKEIHLKDSLHTTFSDFPLLADVSGFRQIDPDLVNGELGTINGVRAMQILTTYITAFFNMVLKGKKEPLLGGPSKEFPEVYFTRSG
ncbi:hypothetical protein NA57DRAFT_49394, partial [Rhizodiscina lignyota]